MAAGWAPRNVNSGMFMLGPVLIAFGTAEQRERYLPRILAGEDWWCQGFSEPNAGSDLASLRTSAVRDGDDYVVNGEKVWVTFAQHATRMFFLARTDAARQAAGRHLVLSRRYGDAGTNGRADRNGRRLRRDQRGLVRERARAGGKPRRRRRPRLDVRQVSALERARRRRRPRRLVPNRSSASAMLRAGAGSASGARAGAGLRGATGRARDSSDDARAARNVRRRARRPNAIPRTRRRRTSNWPARNCNRRCCGCWWRPHPTTCRARLRRTTSTRASSRSMPAPTKSIATCSLVIS